MAWGQGCQPRLPHQLGPLLSLLFHPVLRTLSILSMCVTPHTHLSSTLDGKYS